MVSPPPALGFASLPAERRGADQLVYISLAVMKDKNIHLSKYKYIPHGEHVLLEAPPQPTRTPPKYMNLRRRRRRQQLTALQVPLVGSRLSSAENSGSSYLGESGLHLVQQQLVEPPLTREKEEMEEWNWFLVVSLRRDFSEPRIRPPCRNPFACGAERVGQTEVLQLQIEQRI